MCLTVRQVSRKLKRANKYANSQIILKKIMFYRLLTDFANFQFFTLKISSRKIERKKNSDVICALCETNPSKTK